MVKLTVTYCAKCGEQIAPILARLGSIYCHDCRTPGTVHHTLSGR